MIGITPERTKQINYKGNHILHSLLLVSVIVITGAIAIVGLRATSNLYTSDSKKPTLYSSDTSKTVTGNMPTLPQTNTQPLNHVSSDVIQTQTSTGTHSTQAKVTVNGQNIVVPANGNVSKTISSPDGTKSTVNISSSNSAEGNSASSFSSTNLTINLHSSSSSSASSN